MSRRKPNKRARAARRVDPAQPSQACPCPLCHGKRRVCRGCKSTGRVSPARAKELLALREQKARDAARQRGECQGPLCHCHSVYVRGSSFFAHAPEGA